MTQGPMQGWGAPPAQPPPPLAAAPVYAGFWLRLVAHLIDSFVIGFVAAFAGGVLTGILTAALGGGRKTEAMVPLLLVVFYGSGFLLSWLYFAVLESSGSQASLGKMALGLAVTDADGRRIGFGRASGRFLAKTLSWIPLCVGFLLAAFTGRKQALHDLVAGTLVVRRGESRTAAVVIAVIAVVFGGVAITGVLAAIAIPNFLRYQLRSKSSEAVVQLESLHAAQLAHLQRTGAFAPLELPADGAPGTVKMVWGPDDVAAAAALDWVVPASTYFSYRVEAGATGEGQAAYAACAESDIDGDGAYAAVVLWQPATNAQGELVALPPTPPCAHAPETERDPTFQEGDPVGTPVRITADNVF